jgi:hypothetical protein
MLKKSASQFCSFGLFGLSGCLVERREPNKRNQPDKLHKPDGPDKPGLRQTCGPSKLLRAEIVFPLTVSALFRHRFAAMTVATP